MPTPFIAGCVVGCPNCSGLPKLIVGFTPKGLLVRCLTHDLNVRFFPLDSVADRNRLAAELRADFQRHPTRLPLDGPLQAAVVSCDLNLAYYGQTMFCRPCGKAAGVAVGFSPNAIVVFCPKHGEVFRYDAGNLRSWDHAKSRMKRAAAFSVRNLPPLDDLFT